jgi:hypothetical protein
MNIEVRQLEPSEIDRIHMMTAGLSGDVKVTSADGEEVHLPYRLPFIIAASVGMIDGEPMPFPRSRRELDAIYDLLDIDGLAAAAALLFGRQ